MRHHAKGLARGRAQGDCVCWGTTYDEIGARFPSSLWPSIWPTPGPERVPRRHLSPEYEAQASVLLPPRLAPAVTLNVSHVHTWAPWPAWHTRSASLSSDLLGLVMEIK